MTLLSLAICIYSSLMIGLGLSQPGIFSPDKTTEKTCIHISLDVNFKMVIDFLISSSRSRAQSRRGE